MARFARHPLVARSLPYLVAALAALACAFYLLELWRISWNIPMYYSNSGDTTGIYSLVKTLADGTPFLYAPELGAPFGAHPVDFPTPNLLHLGILRALIALTSSWAAAVNLYFVLLFPLTAVTAHYALRRLGVPVGAAIALAVVYSFLPIRLERNQSHLFYTAYYLAPLMVLVAVWIMRGVPLFDPVRRRPLRAGALALAVALAVSWDNPYYVLFAGVLFAAAAAAAVVRTRQWMPAVAALALLAVMAAGLAVAFSPTLAYRAQHGPNAVALKRQPEQAELLALSLIQLVLPIEGHRVQSLASGRDYYNTRMLPTNLVNENSTASMGILASLGFAGLLVGLLVVRRPRDDQVWPDVSRLTLVAFILATVGGLGALFAFYVFKEFRAYNRISPIIAFLSLAAVGFALNALGARFPRVSTGWRIAALAALAVVALADETSPAFVPRYNLSAARYGADEAVAQTVQSALGRGANVLELPTMKYPEGDPAYGLHPYDELSLYLHTHGVRWSFGGVAGRPEGDWAATITAKPPREMVEAALIAGFSGIVVFRRGYLDSGSQIEHELVAVTGVSPTVGPDGAIAVFAFPALSAGIDRLLDAGPSEPGSHTAGLSLDYGAAFYVDEEKNGRHWRWASSAAALVVHNATGNPIKGRLSFSAASAAPADTMTLAAGDDAPLSVAISEQGVSAHLDHVFVPGDTVVRFTPSARPTHLGSDPRALSFQLANVVLRGADVDMLRRLSPSL